ncbi:ABC transporter permease [Oceaniglobus trochenteri]|uniref:ABC transporter permease n=1 Tax=Oceaniglobus trochenteri TaxID=2763260 RepID=UPI001CFF5CD4|nr:ABC transporter permease [Oceaniglobus trochenteri]
MSDTRKQEIGLMLSIVLIFGLAALVDARAATLDTFIIWGFAMPLVMVAAMGQIPVLLCGHVDISIGSLLALSAILVGMLFRAWPEMPLVLGFLAGTCIGALLGVINGFLVTRLRIHSIIVTLGTLSLFRGLTFIVSDSRQIDPNDLPGELIALSQVGGLGVPPIMIVVAVIVAAMFVLIHRSGIGGLFYAVGANEFAARMRGIATDRMVLLAFVLSGALVGLTGVLFASRFGYVNPAATGSGFELQVISAAVVGGVSIAGGRGSVIGCALGVMLIAAIEVIMPKIGISRVWQDVVFGLIVLAALGIDRAIQTRGGRKTQQGDAA